MATEFTCLGCDKVFPKTGKTQFRCKPCAHAREVEIKRDSDRARKARKKAAKVVPVVTAKWDHPWANLGIEWRKEPRDPYSSASRYD